MGEGPGKKGCRVSWWILCNPEGGRHWTRSSRFHGQRGHSHLRLLDCRSPVNPVSQGVFGHTEAQGLQPVVDVRFSHRKLEFWLLEHQHVLRRGVHGQRAGPLDRAVGAAWHAVAAPGVGEPEVLSSLFHDGGVGGGVALVGADKPTGAQEAKAGGRDVPRGDLVLAWVPSAHAAAHRAGRREGVGLPKATISLLSISRYV